MSSIDFWRSRVKNGTSDSTPASTWQASRRGFVGIGFNFFEIVVEDIEEVRIGDNFRPEVRWKAEYRYGGPGFLVGLTF